MVDSNRDYREFRQRLYRDTIYASTMPDELFRSRPLPTQRWRVAAFATFGAGRRLRPAPPVYSAPSRWIVAAAASLITPTPRLRHELATLLAAENPGDLLLWHRELVPDFFAWLDA